MRVVPLAVALLLAGCASAPSLPLPAMQPDADPPPVQPSPLGWASFAGSSFLEKTLWFNGSFKATQASRLANEAPPLPATAQPSEVVFEITGELPRGVPVKIAMRVDAEVGRGDVDMWLDAPQEDYRTGSGRAPYGGTAEVILTIVHAGGGPVTVHLAYDVAGESPEVPYSLSVRLSHMPRHLPGGVATALHLDAPAPSLTVMLMGEKRAQGWFEPERARLMVWSPSDAFVGAFELEDDANTTVPIPAEPGEFVLMLSQGGRELKIATPSNATLSPLTHDWIVGEVVRGSSAQSVEWSVDLARVPLLVGIIFQGSAVAQDVTASLAGPAGPLLDERITGGPWLNANLPTGQGFQNAFWIDCGYGVAGLVAGMYSAKVEFGQAAGPEPASARSLAVFYKR